MAMHRPKQLRSSLYCVGGGGDVPTMQQTFDNNHNQDKSNKKVKKTRSFRRTLSRTLAAVTRSSTNTPSRIRKSASCMASFRSDVVSSASLRSVGHGSASSLTLSNVYCIQDLGFALTFTSNCTYTMRMLTNLYTVVHCCKFDWNVGDSLWVLDLDDSLNSWALIQGLHCWCNLVIKQGP